MTIHSCEQKHIAAKRKDQESRWNYFPPPARARFALRQQPTANDGIRNGVRKISKSFLIMLPRIKIVWLQALEIDIFACSFGGEWQRAFAYRNQTPAWDLCVVFVHCPINRLISRRRLRSVFWIFVCFILSAFLPCTPMRLIENRCAIFILHPSAYWPNRIAHIRVRIWAQFRAGTSLSLSHTVCLSHGINLLIVSGNHGWWRC